MLSSRDRNQWLKAFPKVANRVLQLLAEEDIPLVEIAQEVNLDPVLAASILQVANSPVYQPKREIYTIPHAISWIGRMEIAGLVLGLQMASFTKANESRGNYYKDYWRQSFIQGCAMSRFAEFSGQFTPGQAYLCGLLMDFGRLMLLDQYQQEYDQIIDEAQHTGSSLHHIEKDKLGVTHAELGKQLLDGMGLPGQFGNVARQHIITHQDLQNKTDDSDYVLTAAAVASSAVADFYCRNNQADSLATLETISRQCFQMGEGDIQWLMDSVNVDIEARASIFSVDLSTLLPMGQLIGHANGQMRHEADRVRRFDAVTSRLEAENKILKKLITRLEDHVCKDQMTGIYNRDYFNGQFEERLAHAIGSEFVLIVIDIDKFKLINDNEGHLVGDKAIVWVADILNRYFQDELVARYGGDEFVALTAFESKTELETCLEKLCQLIHADSTTALKREEALTISVGAAVCQISKPTPSLESHLFKTADQAMYQSKRSGGNQGNVVLVTDLNELPIADMPSSHSLNSALTHLGS